MRLHPTGFEVMQGFEKVNCLEAVKQSEPNLELAIWENASLQGIKFVTAMSAAALLSAKENARLTNAWPLLEYDRSCGRKQPCTVTPSDRGRC